MIAHTSVDSAAGIESLTPYTKHTSATCCGSGCARCFLAHAHTSHIRGSVCARVHAGHVPPPSSRVPALALHGAVTAPRSIAPTTTKDVPSLVVSDRGLIFFCIAQDWEMRQHNGEKRLLRIECASLSHNLRWRRKASSPGARSTGSKAVKMASRPPTGSTQPGASTAPYTRSPVSSTISARRLVTAAKFVISSAIDGALEVRQLTSGAAPRAMATYASAIELSRTKQRTRRAIAALKERDLAPQIRPLARNGLCTPAVRAR